MKVTIPIKYGLFIAAGLIGYFLILSIFGAHTNPYYSVFNLVIVGTGMFAAITAYKKNKGGKFKYQKGFMAGLAAGFTSTVIFTIFFLVYATEINPDFMGDLLPMWESDWYSNIGFVIAGVALMGFASTVVLTLAFMQIFKDTWNTKEGREHTY